jgi:hypothetical protein
MIKQSAAAGGLCGGQKSVRLIGAQAIEVGPAEQRHTYLRVVRYYSKAAIHRDGGLPQLDLDIPPLRGGNGVNLIHQFHARGGGKQQEGNTWYAPDGSPAAL